MSNDELRFEIDRRRVTRLLVTVLVVVVALHLFWFATDAYDLPGETLWRRLANVDAENTFPTWLSAVLHLTSAALLAIIARAADTYRRHWWFLSLMFLGFSIDEIASLHETLAAPVRFALGLDGIFYYAWVVPALVAVAVVALVYVRFVLRLPTPVKQRVILAAVLFVGGAIGMEMVAGTFANTPARFGWPYFIVTTIEELMEMGALVLFVDTLLLYMEGRAPRIRLSIGPGRR